MKRILLVDDNASNLYMLRTLLQGRERMKERDWALRFAGASRN